MKLCRVFACITSVMWLASAPAWAVAPVVVKVTKQVVTIRSTAGDTVGKATLVTKTAGKTVTRSLVVKVANFSLPPGTPLGVRINTSNVATVNVVEETDNYDVDGDRIPNDVDLDDDGDGITDPVDLDDDDDGIPDTEEDDADEDGIADFQDDDDDDDDVTDDEEDDDGDGIPDVEDDDADGDGTDDDDEDSDDDDIPDSEDLDDDDDGIPDDLDNDDDGDDIADNVDPDYTAYSGMILVTKTKGVAAAAKGSTITVRLPGGTVIASGKF